MQRTRSGSRSGCGGNLVRPSSRCRTTGRASWPKSWRRSLPRSGKGREGGVDTWTEIRPGDPEGGGGGQWGQIVVDSQEGVGTTFIIRLPLEPPAVGLNLLPAASFLLGLRKFPFMLPPR